MTQTTQTQSNTSYFNLTCDGIGYLNRPRTVTGKHKSSNPYFACTVQALRGDDGSKTRFDLRVVGTEAKEIFERLLAEFPVLLENSKNKPTVLIGFRASDLQALTFETTNRETGEIIETLSIDGRLLKFKFIKVNGKIWYQSSKDDEQVQTTEETIVEETPVVEVAQPQYQPQVKHQHHVPTQFATA